MGMFLFVVVCLTRLKPRDLCCSYEIFMTCKNMLTNRQMIRQILGRLEDVIYLIDLNDLGTLYINIGEETKTKMFYWRPCAAKKRLLVLITG